MSWKSAKFAITGGFYQQSVSQSCLAVELFLKSRLLVIDPYSELDKSHDCLNIFYVLLKKYPTKKDLLQVSVIVGSISMNLVILMAV